MTPSQLLEHMCSEGFTVRLVRGVIDVYPTERITDDLRAAIRANRDDLAALLESVQQETSDLLERMRLAEPNKWTAQDLRDAKLSVSRDYPAGLTSLRILARQRKEKA